MVARAEPGSAVAEEAFSLRPQDVVLTLAATLAAAILAFYGRHVPGAWKSIGTYAFVAMLPWAFRAVEHRWPSRATNFLATIVPPALGMVLVYSALDPLCDLLNPHLADPRLAAVDLALFGLHPGLWLEQHLPAHVVDALYVCYTSYYVWPLSLGVLLFFDRREKELDRFILGYALLMLGSYVCYLMVPAIGPRFYLVGDYPGAVHATWVGQWFDSLFRGSPYFRDCFPSGHTALTLYCLYHARRLTPRWFWVMLLPASGLIAATLVCRFHYAIDLLCGPLLTVAAILAADALYQRLPRMEVTRDRLAMAFNRR